MSPQHPKNLDQAPTSMTLKSKPTNKNFNYWKITNHHLQQERIQQQTTKDWKLFQHAENNLKFGKTKVLILQK